MSENSRVVGLARYVFDQARGPEYAMVVDDRVTPLVDVLGGATPTTQAELFDHWDKVSEALANAADLPLTDGVALDRTRVLAPLEPRQIFQSGANYRSHVMELRVAHALQKDASADVEQLRREAAATMDSRAATGEPYVFCGLPTSICGPYDDVLVPAGTDQFDWELELAVVIGQRADHVDRANALQYVAGYTIANDLTRRDLVFRPDMPSIGTDWLASKNGPTFLPVGPVVVPAALVADPDDIGLTLQLNGEVMQDATTGDMIFDVPRLIEHVSAITPLLPGDLLLTGSPAGNGIHHGRMLRVGDTMRSSLTGMGFQENHCVGSIA